MIPPRYQNAKYEDVPEQIRTLFENIHKTKRGIYLHGAVGTGKTHIAYALKEKYAQPEFGRYARMWNVTEMLRDIRADFEKKGYDKKRVEEDVLEHNGLVILDDVGSEKMTEWVAETFYMIINKRYVYMKPIIITSNLAIPDLSEWIGDRTTSRIVEMCDVVELDGRDRRLSNRPKIHVKI